MLIGRGDGGLRANAGGRRAMYVASMGAGERKPTDHQARLFSATYPSAAPAAFAYRKKVSICLLSIPSNTERSAGRSITSRNVESSARTPTAPQSPFDLDPIL